MKLIFTRLLLMMLVCDAGAAFTQVSNYSLAGHGLVFNNMIIDGEELILSGILTRSQLEGKQGLLFVRMDTTGAIRDYSVFYDTIGDNYSLFNGGIPGGLVRCPDSTGYIILCHVYERKAYTFIKISLDGEQAWVKEIAPDPYSVNTVYSKIISAGNYYLIGGRKQGLNFKSDIVVRKVDRKWNEIWERKYGEENEKGDFFSDILFNGPDDIIVSGSISPGNVPLEEKSIINQIFAIDSNGMTKWKWESLPSLNETVRGLSQDNIGNWNYATIHLDYYSDNQFKCLPKFIRRDASFDILVETELDDADAFNNYLQDMIQLSDGGHLGVGINYEAGNPYGHAYAWIIKIDALGNVEWERKDLTFPDTDIATTQYLNSAVELPGGSVIAAGYYTSSGDPNEYGVLIKVTKDGCIDTVCTTTSLLDQLSLSAYRTKIYPNPCSEYLNVETPLEMDAAFFELFDLSGRRLTRTDLVQGGVTKLSIQDLKLNSGLFVWRILDERGVSLDSGKVVVD